MREKIDCDEPSLRESPRLRAFAVLEEDEGTGGIIFARHAITARRLGANEYACGEFGYVRCNRAPWADEYTDGCVPVSLMVENGWHFECTGCGIRIDSDLPFEHEKPTSGIIGHQHSAVFCDAACERAHRAERAEAERRQGRAIARFKRIVQRRFPGVEFLTNDDQYIFREHAYVCREAGRWRMQQVSVSFAFPGMNYGPASLRYDRGYGKPQKPYYTCANGDREAFQRFVQAHSSPGNRKDGSSQKESPLHSERLR